LTKKVNRLEGFSDKSDLKKITSKVDHKASKKELEVLDRSLKDELRSLKKHIKSIGNGVSASGSPSALPSSIINPEEIQQYANEAVKRYIKDKYVTKSDLAIFMKKNAGAFKKGQSDNVKNVLNDDQMNVILEFVNRELMERFTNHAMLMDSYIAKIENMEKRMQGLQMFVSKSKF
jgi:hypothetical protein